MIESAAFRIIRDLQTVSLREGAASSADPIAAQFNRKAAYKVLEKIGLFKTFQLVLSILKPKAADHAAIIGLSVN